MNNIEKMYINLFYRRRGSSIGKFGKYIVSIISGIIGYWLFFFVVITWAGKVNGGDVDMAIVEDGIFLMAGLIVGCTTLIMFSIKEHSKK